jgi:hypothetical protein
MIGKIPKFYRSMHRAVSWHCPVISRFIAVLSMKRTIHCILSPRVWYVVLESASSAPRASSRAPEAIRQLIRYVIPQWHIQHGASSVDLPPIAPTTLLFWTLPHVSSQTSYPLLSSMSLRRRVFSRNRPLVCGTFYDTQARDQRSICAHTAASSAAHTV